MLLNFTWLDDRCQIWFIWMRLTKYEHLQQGSCIILHQLYLGAQSKSAGERISPVFVTVALLVNNFYWALFSSIQGHAANYSIYKLELTRMGDQCVSSSIHHIWLTKKKSSRQQNSMPASLKFTFKGPELWGLSSTELLGGRLVVALGLSMEKVALDGNGKTRKQTSK